MRKGQAGASSAKNTDERAHAVFSASGSSRWSNCPGSISLSEDAPPQRESVYALEGTEAHSCLEFLLKNRSNFPGAMLMAKKKYPADMLEHGKEAALYIMERSERMPDADFLCESRVDASPFTCADQFGTLDAAIVQEFGRLVVIDYKYGAGVAVDPEGYDGRGNSQLVYYALGISYAYEHNFSEVELVVIQPRAYHPSGNTTRSFVMSMDALLEWEDTFLDGVLFAQSAALHKGTNAFNAFLKAGDWCRFCPAATICPILKDEALRDAQIAFSDSHGIDSMPEPKLIQIPDLGVILDACDRLDSWIARVREHAFHVLNRGEEVRGFKLVQKKSTRRWRDEQEVANEARSLLGDAAFSAPKLLSPAQLGKLLSTRSNGRKWIERRTSSVSSGVTIVREDDKRLAVNRSTAAFTDVTIETIDVEYQGKKSKRKKG